MPRTIGQDCSPLLVNAGSGRRGGGQIPMFFRNWRQLRVDADPAVDPDIVADITALQTIPDSVADALWSAHCVEHLHQHQVPLALREFRRVIKDDGFVCIVVPDLQSIANFIAADQLGDIIYSAPAGPVTAHDVVFGYGRAIASGLGYMAHHCGFTPSILVQVLREAHFAEFVIRRRVGFELAVVARKTPWPSRAERESLVEKLDL